MITERTFEIIKTMPGESTFSLFKEKEELNPHQRVIGNFGDTKYAFIHCCYVLLENEKPKARAILYQNPGLFYKNKKAVAIGNYECAEDENISKSLLNFIIQDAKNLNAAFLIGPMNGSTWENYRFSLRNNFENFLLEPAHPVYYNQQFLSSGFKPIAYYSSRKNSNFFCNNKEVLQKENHLLNFGIAIRNIDIRNFERELENLYPFVCSAFSNNFLFTPISKDIFINKFLQFKTIINPEFVLIAEDENEAVIGFIFCYDDVLNKKEKSLVIKTLARDRSEKWSGLGAVMANQVISQAKSRGYESIIHAFMLDDGNSSETSEKFFGTVYKKYVLYGLEL